MVKRKKCLKAGDNTWTEVMDVHVPKIDVFIFDAEEYIDRFHF